jgi:hypothetical protein
MKERMAWNTEIMITLLRKTAVFRDVVAVSYMLGDVMAEVPRLSYSQSTTNSFFLYIFLMYYIETAESNDRRSLV